MNSNKGLTGQGLMGNEERSDLVRHLRDHTLLEMKKLADWHAQQTRDHDRPFLMSGEHAKRFRDLADAADLLDNLIR